ncbi:hypothetical protein [Streptomyces sp. NPDC057428]|uniref:hypothetical protein n=1 Tax=Streptomyces sp. NPDC057428 TaxID=3346129 RepID=UPI0036ADDEA0
MSDDHERLSGPEGRPREAGPGHGGALRRDTPRGRGYGPAWLWLAAGIAGLGAGIVVGHGLLIAAGLVLAGIAGQLYDPERRRARRRMPRPR